MVNKLLSERGVALVISLMVLLVLTILGAALMITSTTETRISGNQLRDTQALCIAEAGVEEVGKRMMLAASDADWIGDPVDTNIYWQTKVFLTQTDPPDPKQDTIVYVRTIQDPNMEYLKYSVPDGGDTSLALTVTHKVAYDVAAGTDRVVRYNSIIKEETFDTGQPIYLVKSLGRKGNAQRGVEVGMSESTREFELNITATLASDKWVDMRGNVSLCGHDHVLIDRNHDLWGVACPRPQTPPPDKCVNIRVPDHPLVWPPPFEDCLPCISTTFDSISHRGNWERNYTTCWEQQDTSVTFFPKPWEVYGKDSIWFWDTLMVDADTVVENPMDGIYYLKGPANINANTEGAGLIYCVGNLDIAGGFTYAGLIYVDQNADGTGGDLRMNGNFWMLGAMLAEGSTDWDNPAAGGGNPTLLWSSEAAASPILTYMPTDRIVISWRER